MCLKLNKKCEICKKAVLKDEFDQHHQDEHVAKKPVEKPVDKPVVALPQVYPSFS